MQSLPLRSVDSHAPYMNSAHLVFSHYNHGIVSGVWNRINEETSSKFRLWNEGEEQSGPVEEDWASCCQGRRGGAQGSHLGAGAVGEKNQRLVLCALGQERWNVEGLLPICGRSYDTEQQPTAAVVPQGAGVTKEQRHLLLG